MTVWTSALLLFVVANLVFALKGKGKAAESWALVKSLRPVMFVANLPVLAAVIATGALLMQVPGLDWGWYKALTGSDGNAMVSSATGSLWVFLPFLVLLLLALPQLALGEEEAFRSGTTGARSMWVRSVLFGLIHCVVGVSIGLGLALSISGLWYTRQYRKGRALALKQMQAALDEDGLTPVTTPGMEMVAVRHGVRRSAAYHLAWNLTVISLLTTAVIVTEVAS